MKAFAFVSLVSIIICAFRLMIRNAGDGKGWRRDDEIH